MSIGQKGVRNMPKGNVAGLPTTKSKPADYVDRINEIADEINVVLNDRKKDKYFESVTLLYSFIENVLKWLVYSNALWQMSQKAIPVKGVRAVRVSGKRLSFYQASNSAYLAGLMDFDLFKRIESVREERNKVIHQFWTYEHRGNRSVMRKKLEKLANTANQLVGIFNKLTKEIGVDEVYELSL